MLKEALQYVVDLQKTETFSLASGVFSSKKLHRITAPVCREHLDCSTLYGIVTYLGAVDTVEAGTFVNVVDPQLVNVISPLNGDRRREIYLRSIPNVSGFPFGMYQDLEMFIVGLKTCFVDVPKTLLETVGFVQDRSVAEIFDDGISQSMKIETGVKGGQDVDVKGEFVLRPYRTFPEIEQPASMFVLRLKKKNNEPPQAALFGADGGAWQVAAIDSIKKYLSEKLPEVPIVA